MMDNDLNINAPFNSMPFCVVSRYKTDLAIFMQSIFYIFWHMCIHPKIVITCRPQHNLMHYTGHIKSSLTMVKKVI